MDKQTVLIADDDPGVLQTVGEWCRRSGLNVVTASNGVEAVLKIKQQEPDLLIVDIDMPHADGFRVCQRLQELSSKAVPTIVLTGLSDQESIQHCRAIGAHFLAKDHDTWDNLGPLLLKVTASVANKPEGGAAGNSQNEATVAERRPRILVVDDDPDVTAAIKIRLSYYAAEIEEANDGIEGYNRALARKPDVIVTDYNMPHGSGDHMMVRLKQNAATKDIPVIVLTGETNEFGRNIPLQRDVLGRRGAAAFMAKPLDFDVLIGELQKHVKTRLELRKKPRAASAQ